jgi:hypothetical protein
MDDEATAHEEAGVAAAAYRTSFHPFQVGWAVSFGELRLNDDGYWVVPTMLSKEGAEPMAKDGGVWPRETEPETSGSIAAATAVEYFVKLERENRHQA